MTTRDECADAYRRGLEEGERQERERLLARHEVGLVARSEELRDVVSLTYVDIYVRGLLGITSPRRP